jgi:dUTP pyrophosphatase
MILEYHRVREDAIPPTRANPSDAGLDVHYNPDGKYDRETVLLGPNQSAIFSTGLKFGIPHGYMLEVKNRSGNAAKKKLLVGACVIDSGYDGEIFVNLHNVGNETQIIERGDKIAQLVLVPVVHFRALETPNDNLYNWYPITISDRGDGALGSTDQPKAKTAPTPASNQAASVDVFSVPKNWELGDSHENR